MDLFFKIPFFICLLVLSYNSFANGFSKEDIDVNFYLYTRQSQEDPQRLFYQDVSKLKESFFEEENPVVLIIHGFGGNKDSEMNGLIKNVYLPLFDVNMIVVEWKSDMKDMDDTLTIESGKFVGKFIDWLSEQGVPFSNIHLIAHSLGAQLAGIAGRSCTLGKVGYISALDPPRRGWEGHSRNISPTDGAYVEVMHTYIAGNSLIQPAGHVDFYPNAGLKMPGCDSEENLCSHLRAYEYFAESIGNDRFMADKCTNYEELSLGKCAMLGKLHMGGAHAKNASGVFYLETNAEKPFYKA